MDDDKGRSVSEDEQAVRAPGGSFVDREGDRYYLITDVDAMPAFFISVVSDSDHWLFVSSRGGLTAGRVSPENALFPYITDDKIHDAADFTGPRTLIRKEQGANVLHWRPFLLQKDHAFQVQRNLYKNTLGNKLCFEEINFDLELIFRYTWMTCEPYGFVRDCELVNTSSSPAKLTVVDGLQNLQPAEVPRKLQSTSSNLVDAYKWTELDPDTGLAMFTLYSGITDKPEPQEVLHANTCFCLGNREQGVLLSEEQFEKFESGRAVGDENIARGVRGYYLNVMSFELAPGRSERWMIIADVEQSQAQVVKLRQALLRGELTRQGILDLVARGSTQLRRLMGSADGFQVTAEENVSVHHYANVLFNCMRGGVYHDQYTIHARDFVANVRFFNRSVASRHQAFLAGLPPQLPYADLLAAVVEQGDARLESLAYEYLPITFGRRHGDPSRPWNEFAIRLKDEKGEPLLYYQGNWRDIFQNWEALSISYPEFIENVVAKFVNASTLDGYNPYRITKDGIDWEVEDPEDPWSYIGYWGDHQIIYLLKLLEMSRNFHPEKLSGLLRHPIFGYANVPYRIKTFERLVADPKNTVEYDHTLADVIEQRVAQIGADGKRVLDADGGVYQVNLLEKLLVPLLSKLGNLVLDGGIWLNTQRPEWNDANNALVGPGLSMVTLYYLRRYIRFMQSLLRDESESVSLTDHVHDWVERSNEILTDAVRLVRDGPVGPTERFDLLRDLCQASDRYREAVFVAGALGSKRSSAIGRILELLSSALVVVDHTISANRRDEGLYHAYNLLSLGSGSVSLRHLYPMLEGQVAALSSGGITPKDGVQVIQALYESEVYRPDQHTFMLYPDRKLPGFLAKNRIDEQRVNAIPLLGKLLEAGDDSIVCRDAEGHLRFSAELSNMGMLDAALDALASVHGDDVTAAAPDVRSLYDAVFRHQEFTGRSGGMFGFEGLGCVYWHMVSKLLLAVQELCFSALDAGDLDTFKQLGALYYRVREGIGFNKTPVEYGAFPTDPYSHTPKHSGARQPGMTGQVKEEIVTRFGELGVRVAGGVALFQPSLLRASEFLDEPRVFGFVDLDGAWRELQLPAGQLAFTWCQVPVIYAIEQSTDPGLTVSWADGKTEAFSGFALSREASGEIFRRSGLVRSITLRLNASLLFPADSEGGRGRACANSARSE
jgi:hypothetical protein